MKIMSFNTQHCLNYLEKRVDYEKMAEAIKACGADIVGLNEMYDEGSSFGRQTERLGACAELENHYFAEACRFSDGSYGNGFLSRYKIESAKTITIPDPVPRRYDGYYETRCVLKARLENGLVVLVVHFGLNPDEHESAVATILENLEDEKCVLMGDFNVTPDNPALRPIRERLVDTADFFEGEGLSWPSDAPEVKIDYIFVTPDIEVVSAEVPAIIASDHRPHIAEIKFR
ncbi:MAG: endonuclease/exonuclease/phosphatase family protein [Clostridia bacterium]|nr:endonuclease/exonuclease/phosphatase family protein [Clostridia bacterium]